MIGKIIPNNKNMTDFLISFFSILAINKPHKVKPATAGMNGKMKNRNNEIILYKTEKPATNLTSSDIPLKANPAIIAINTILPMYL